MTLKNILLENDYFRLEAEYLIQPKFEFSSLFHGSEIIKSSQYGTSDFLNEEGLGFPILRLNEFDGSFIDQPKKYCNLMSSQTFNDLQLKKGDVLVCRTNGNPNLVGRAAIVMDNYPYAFASYLFKVRVNNKIKPEVLVSFLNCKYGRNEIDRNSMKGNQTNFSPSKFKDIRIPNLKTELQSKIVMIIERSYTLLNESREKYALAETMILDEIGALDFWPSESNISIKPLSSSLEKSERLDAEFYQIKYDDYKKLIGSTKTIGSECSFYSDTFIPDVEKTYSYIELSNIGNQGEINGYSCLRGSELPSRAKRVIHKGNVIVASVEGSLGSCALVTDKYDGFICSNGFFVMDSSMINSEVLLILIKSKPIQELIKQRCSGTILTTISKEEFMKVPLPEIGEKLQNRISILVKEALEYRTRSQQLVIIAEKVIEIAVEKDEDSALVWISSQIDLF